MRRERVTIVQLARFGDIIQTSPLIQNLKREGGVEREVTLAVDRRAAPAARLLDGVDGVVELDLSDAANRVAARGIHAWNELRDWARGWLPYEPADRLILLNQGEFTSAVATLIPAKTKEGPFLRRPLPLPHAYLNQAVQKREQATLHLAEVWAAYGPRILPLRAPRLRASALGTGVALLGGERQADSLKTTRFAVNLGAGGKERVLPAAKLAALVNELARSGAEQVVLLGLEQDRETARELREGASPDVRARLLDLTGRTRIEDLPGVLNACRLLISSDTGTLQLASALDIHTVGLFFGGANPVETGAYRAGAVAKQVSGSTRGAGAEALDFRSIARLAHRIADETWQPNGIEHDTFGSLLVARSSSVGPEYIPAVTTPAAQAALQRRRAADRRLLWGLEETAGTSGSNSRDPRIPADDGVSRPLISGSTRMTR